MNNTPYIGFWKRAAAFAVDGILVSIPPAVICGPILYNLASGLQADENSDAALLTLATMITVYVVWQILGLVSFWLYFALCESGAKQATWGKRLMGIKVVDYHGNRIGFGRATGRTFAKILSYALFYVGFLMAGNTRRKRALHDYIAQTYVVRKDFEPGGELPDTKSHKLRLCLITACLFLLTIAWLGTTLIASTAATAQTAAARLTQLAQENQPLREPLLENGITYTRSRTGYRARFEDKEAGSYTLLLRGRNASVCCEQAPGGDCRPTGFNACN